MEKRKMYIVLFYGDLEQIGYWEWDRNRDREEVWQKGRIRIDDAITFWSKFPLVTSSQSDSVGEKRDEKNRNDELVLSFLF